MDRQIIFPGQIPLETDLLSTNKNALLALGFLAQDVLGLNTLASGLGCAPTSPAGMSVQIAPGRLYSLQNVDDTAYSSLAADLVHTVLKQGIMLDADTLALTAPSTSGHSVNYLIEAAFSEVDAESVLLPYYNSSNPAQPYSGPNNTGVSQYTKRKGTITLVAKPGIAATTGSQTTPAPDSGYVGLWVVTVAYGQSSIVAGNIAQYNSGAAWIKNTLNLLAPLLSPALTGAPTAPTPAFGDSSTKLATTAFVAAALAAMTNALVAGGTVNALTGTISGAVVTTLSNGQSVLVRASGANTSTATTFNLTLGSTATGAKTIYGPGGVALAISAISGAGHWLQLTYDSTLDGWILLNPVTRIKLAANLTLYVSATGNDTTGDGLTAGTAFATVQKASNVLQNNYDLGGYQVTIQLLDGTYTSGLTVNGYFVGAKGLDAVTIKGNATTPSNVLVNTAGNCFTANWAAQFIVKDLRVKSTSWAGLSATNYSNIGFSNLVFDTCGQAHISAIGAKIQALGNYSIVGGGGCHILEDQGGNIYLSGTTVTISGTPAFSQAFATLSNLSFAYATGMTFSGTGATGIRYNVTSNSVLNTGGGGVSYLPGSIAGSYASGGAYV